MIALWLYLWFAAEPCSRLQVRAAKHAPLIVWVSS